MPPCGRVFTGRVACHLFMPPCGRVFTGRVACHLFMPPFRCVFTSRLVGHLFIATMWSCLHAQSPINIMVSVDVNHHVYSLTYSLSSRVVYDLFYVYQMVVTSQDDYHFLPISCQMVVTSQDDYHFLPISCQVVSITWLYDRLTMTPILQTLESLQTLEFDG